MLPGISCHVLGWCRPKKASLGDFILGPRRISHSHSASFFPNQELFFYGAGFGNMYKAGMAALHGPEIPLEMFRRREMHPR